MAKTPQKILEKNRRYRERNRERLREKYKQYYNENREKCLAAAKTYAASHPEKRSSGTRKRWTAMRHALFAKLGEQCIRCGFDDWRALQIDHVNGGGTQERKKFTNRYAYYAAMLEAENGKLQVLCANCHQIKLYESWGHVES